MFRRGDLRMNDIGCLYVHLSINDTQCTYCLECINVCPSGALSYDHCFEHNPTECMKCRMCMDCCPEDAIRVRM